MDKAVSQRAIEEGELYRQSLAINNSNNSGSSSNSSSGVNNVSTTPNHHNNYNSSSNSRSNSGSYNSNSNNLITTTPTHKNLNTGSSKHTMKQLHHTTGTSNAPARTSLGFFIDENQADYATASNIDNSSSSDIQDTGLTMPDV